MENTEIDIEGIIELSEQVKLSAALRTFITVGYFKSYLLNIVDIHRIHRLREAASFEEEIKLDWRIIHQAHTTILNKISISKSEEDLIDFLSNRPFIEFLILLGQRITPGSITDFIALPPSKTKLKAALFKPYNKEIKLGVRAWEKHAGRTELDFWGDVHGTPSYKEQKVNEIVTYIFKNIAWWNVFEHYKHGAVYEIREPKGHGLRWKLNELAFIGFVEPFE